MNFSTPQTYTLTAQDSSTKVYTVTVAADPTYPASSGAMLTAVEDTATALTAANFGYTDPNSLELAAVQITALPIQGVLKLSGTAVANGDIVIAANIPNLTYQPALYGYGTPYTTIGIKVMNANNVWNIADSVMTVNVAYVNHPPTSTGASLTVKGGSFYTFWTTDFPFSDVDVGDWLTAVRITSLPVHGTLMLAGTPITAVPSAAIPAAHANTLTYSPNANYVGSDSFNYQVSDGKAFSADAAMAIAVQSPFLISVLNGSFETPDPVWVGPGSNDYSPWTDGNWTYIPSPWASSGSNYGRINVLHSGTFSSAPDGKWVALIGTGQTSAVPLSQDLGVSVGAGDMLSVTFWVGNGIGGTGGQGVAYFKSYTTTYPMAFDTTVLTAGTWHSYTMTQTIIEPGNLSLGFYWTGGGGSWLDNVSNVTITPAAAVAVNAPTTSGAVLTVLQDTATALTAGNFGYTDPGSVALAAVRIVALPGLGTLKYNGATVLSSTLPLTVTAANIGKLTYQGALNGYGNPNPYTMIGVMVENANSLWSAPAWMTVNVTAINHPPTSIGASVFLKPNTVKTLATGDFPFADIDTGDTLGAIKVVTTLPAHGTLSLNGTPITSVPSAIIPVASIGTLTYTPAADYLGADSFKYQVRDASLFSADATMAITVTSDIFVLNGSFESPGAAQAGAWAMFGSPWPVTGLPSNNQQIQAASGGVFTSAVDGTWIALISTNDVSSAHPLVQNLGASVAAGDTLSVTFWIGRPNSGTGGQGVAYFDVGGTKYPSTFDTTSLAAGSWQSVTMTLTITNAGNLSLGFYATTQANSFLDKISNISVIPTKAPNSTNATLTATEDIATALAASNFGYADPNSAALAAVRITSLPALGTLKYNGTTVVSGALPLTVAAANIGNLTYQSALYGYGTPYTTFGIMVQNVNGLWSIGAATMTVNVMHVNHPPTSAGGSAILPEGTIKTFTAGDFPFADVDTSDTLSAIKVTSLPAHGTLNLGGTNITSAPSVAIPVANIGTLTYTPATNYSGPDSFRFQVSDGTVFSADATMAITVKYAKYITVQNGSFESPTPVWVGPGAIDYSPIWCDGLWAFTPAPWTTTMDNNYGRLQVSGISVHGPNPVFGPWMANLVDTGRAITQNLGATVNAGDTLSVTFQVMRDQYGSGLLQASFLVGTTEYSQTFDTSTQTTGAWVPLTLNQTIPTGVSGNLSLRFGNVSGRAGWLDNIGNVSVISSATYAGWATANGVTGGANGDSNHDGVPNGIAYFMGVTGPAANPVLDAGRMVTWTNGGNIPSSAYGTQFVVKTSTDLVNWTTVAGADPNLSNTAGSVSYTLPSGAAKIFVRLVVTPN